MSLPLRDDGRRSKRPEEDPRMKRHLSQTDSDCRAPSKDYTNRVTKNEGLHTSSSKKPRHDYDCVDAHRAYSYSFPVQGGSYIPAPAPRSSPELWSMGFLETFYTLRGYKDEVEFVRQAEFETQQSALLSGKPITPVHLFSLKVGIRLLELIRMLRKMEEDAKARQNTSFSGRSFSGNHRDNSGTNRGNRRGGGRGGSSVCFKCNEPGHFARECPTGGGSGYSGGRGGSGRGRGQGGGNYERQAKWPRKSESEDWGDSSKPATTTSGTVDSEEENWEDDDSSSKTEVKKTSKNEEEDWSWEPDAGKKSEPVKSSVQSASVKDDSEEDWE